MVADLWKKVNKGDIVRIFSPELVEPMRVDERLFTVSSIVRSCIELVSPNGKTFKVHKDRIAEICKEGNMEPNPAPTPNPAPNPTPVVETPQPVQEPQPIQEPKTKVKAKAKKDKGLRVDFKAMIASGLEVWSKTVPFTSGDGKDLGYKVDSHYIISADGKTGRVVNTYDGYFPPKNSEGSKYKIDNIEKKREQLKTKGYKRRK